jgi:hypothetical protein
MIVLGVCGSLEVSGSFPFGFRGTLVFKGSVTERVTGKEGWEACIAAGSQGLALSVEVKGPGLEFCIGFNVYIPDVQDARRTKSRG